MKQLTIFFKKLIGKDLTPDELIFIIEKEQQEDRVNELNYRYRKIINTIELTIREGDTQAYLNISNKENVERLKKAGYYVKGTPAGLNEYLVSWEK